MKALWGLLLVWSAIALATRVDPNTFPKELRGSSLTELLQNNKFEVPNNIAEWKALLDNGQLFDTYVPFSGSPFHTDLDEPRYIASNHPYLYIALIQRLNGSLDAEFISWNRDNTIEDFGAIKGSGTSQPELVMSDIKECRTCHRNLAGIFTDRPWNNVTGANAPNGYHLSMAMLGRLMERDEDQYGRYRNLFDNRNTIYDFYFGNLKPEPVVRLADVSLYNVPLFRFRGSFDFDANVRKTHLLVLTYQIMKELPPVEQLRLARTLGEKALLGSVYTDRLDYLFNWNEVLKAEVKLRPALSGLPAMKSPIQKNLMPVFENPELLKNVGLTIADVEADPVVSIMAISKYVREKRISGYRAEDLPNAGDGAFVEFKPAENSSPLTAVNLLMEFSRRDISHLRDWLNESSTTLENLLGNPDVQNTWLRGKRLANKHELAGVFARAVGRTLAFEKWTPGSGMRPGIVDLPVGRFTREQIKNSRCLRCHSQERATSRDIGFPFDPLERAQWEKYLKKPETAPAVRDLAKRMVVKMEKRLMPPPDEPEARGFSIHSGEWKVLIDYLRQIPAP